MLIVKLVRPRDETLCLVGCTAIRPVTSYSLVRPEATRWKPLASLVDYPRWTEPASGLVARLCTRVFPGTKLGTLDVPCAIELSVGSHVDTARRVEVVTVDTYGDGLRITSTDELRSAEVFVEGRRPPSGLALLRYMMRMAAWGADDEPPTQAPLSDVPIRMLPDGSEWVAEETIPLYPRAYFIARQTLEDRERRLHPADAWRRFIGAGG